MCNKIHKNQEWYRWITPEIIEKYNREFYSLVNSAYSNRTINKTTWDFIRTKFHIIPTFYALPKVHKDITKLRGRPIISGRGAVNDNASKLVDEFLKPFVSSLPSFVKDTIHFLKILEDLYIPQLAILVTIDVEALYNLIPHSKGLVTIQHIIGVDSAGNSSYNCFILSLQEFILQHNVFSFFDSHYLQIQGVAMGMSCAPSYANLYLGEWEKMLFSDDSLSMYTNHITSWFCYIDDIFIIWDGPIESLQHFLERMNKNELILP